MFHKRQNLKKLTRSVLRKAPIPEFFFCVIPSTQLVLFTLQRHWICASTGQIQKECISSVMKSTAILYSRGRSKLRLRSVCIKEILNLKDTWVIMFTLLPDSAKTFALVASELATHFPITRTLSQELTVSDFSALSPTRRNGH